MAERKDRARILILSYIAQFSLQRMIGSQHYPGGADSSFHRGSFGGGDVQAGDLVAIQSASPSKWYLGWLISRQRPEGWADDQYAIESIEDGQICNWTNIGLIYYDRANVASHPEWRWTDRQHEFYDRWNLVCYKIRDAYMYLPMRPVFNGDAVTLRTRTRHGFDDLTPERPFPNWRKVTKKMMLEFYDAAVNEAKSAKKQAS